MATRPWIQSGLFRSANDRKHGLGDAHGPRQHLIYSSLRVGFSICCDTVFHKAIDVHFASLCCAV